MSPTTQDRLVNLAFILGASGLVTVSALVTPSASGMGTHEKLGLPPCMFHKWTGIPCFSCGMTTSWAWMAHGHPWMSFKTQPMGALLFLATIAAGLLSLVYLFRGGTIERRFSSRYGASLTIAFWTGLLGGWAYKIVETFAK
ncbi:MAG: DUF2752 domain-containing protein [Planctomycetes bacterium]|nr:DUF2752 domain-containing protein [Planctomycetota bacterium]